MPLASTGASSTPADLELTTVSLAAAEPGDPVAVRADLAAAGGHNRRVPWTAAHLPLAAARRAEEWPRRRTARRFLPGVAAPLRAGILMDAEVLPARWWPWHARHTEAAAPCVGTRRADGTVRRDASIEDRWAIRAVASTRRIGKTHDPEERLFVRGAALCNRRAVRVVAVFTGGKHARRR